MIDSMSTANMRRLARPLKPLVDPIRSAARHRSQQRRTRRQIRSAPAVVEDACGIRFIVYPEDRPSASFYVSRVEDRHTFSGISRLIGPGDVVFDVGAYIGIYSVFASRLVGEKGSVVAFEPVPTTHRRLRETLTLNAVENVAAVEAAVCDLVGTATMNVFEQRYAVWNSLGRPLMSDGRWRLAPNASVEVPATTIDAFCAASGIERVNLLKVDVEGFERSVFLGAQRLLLNRSIDYICFEISQDPLAGAGATARGVFEALERFGYRAYRLRPGGAGFDGPISDSTEYWANYFASWRDLSALRLGDRAPAQEFEARLDAPRASAQRAETGVRR